MKCSRVEIRNRSIALNILKCRLKGVFDMQISLPSYLPTHACVARRSTLRNNAEVKVAESQNVEKIVKMPNSSDSPPPHPPQE
jgi:hypothetical protein